MIDTIPRSHAAIFSGESGRKLPRSFYLGAAIAIVLHAGAAYYLIAHNFSLPASDAPPVVDHPVTVTMDTPVPPKPNTPPPPKNVIPVHATPEPLTQNTETLQLTPVPAVAGPTEGPPAIGTTQGANASSTSAAEPAAVTPRWTRFPDGETLGQYYPARAVENEVEGSATVQCTVLDTAGRVHCTVVAETPKSYNFGAATVKMVEEKGRVDTSQGDIRVGSVLADTTVKWQLN